jgi:hypothetical protein
MDEQMNKQVSYLEFESSQARMERINRRLWVLCLVLIMSLLGTNGAWLYYESQFTDTEVSQDIDTGQGDATVIGIGDYHGESEADN